MFLEVTIMNQIRKLIRLADKIRDSLIEFQKQRLLETHTQLAKYCEQLGEMASESGKLGKSLECNWLKAAAVCNSRIDRLLDDMSYSIQRMKQFTSRDEQKAPSFQSVFDELEQLRQEFDEVELEESENTISVVTEPITLEGLYLGPFRIQLDLGKLSSLHKDSTYFVVAVDPHPAATAEEVTHPHVSNEKLCEGDGYTAIKAALEQGRLTDFFTMVKGILNTYNPDSPYVSLSDWDGTACYDCGYVMSSEDSYYCYQCEMDICSECSTYCRYCEETVCLGCAGQCQVCEEPMCSSCVRECAGCGKLCCEMCLKEDLCPDCKETMETEDEQDRNQNEKDNENKEQIQKSDEQDREADPAVQPDSVGQAIVLQGQNG